MTSWRTIALTLALLTVTPLVVSPLVAGLGPTAAAAPASASGRAVAVDAPAAVRCPAGTVVWRIEGVSRCLKPPASATKGTTPEAAALALVVAPPAVSKVGRKVVAPAPWIPASAWARLRAITVTQATKSVAAARSQLAQGLISPRSSETVSASMPTQQLGSGVTADGSMSATVSSGGGLELGLDVTIGKGRFALDFKPKITIKDPTIPTCPTIDGKLTVTQKFGWSTTVIARDGNKVLSASTQRGTITITSTGVVGEDARFSSATTTYTMSVGSYGRGSQVSATASVTYVTGRTGGPRSSASPVADATVRVSQASQAEQAAAERKVADGVAAALRASNNQAASTAVSIRDKMLDREPGWYALSQNKCVSAQFTPNLVGANPGDTGTTTGTFVMKSNGAKPQATWKKVSAARGSMTPAAAVSGPGADPRFSWTADRPDNVDTTVEVQYLVTSRAGRDQATFIGHASAGDLRITVTGRFTGENGEARGSVDTVTTFVVSPAPGEVGSNWDVAQAYDWDARNAGMYGKNGCSAALTAAVPFQTTEAGFNGAHKEADGYLVYLTPAIMLQGTVSGGPCGSAHPTMFAPTLAASPSMIVHVPSSGSVHVTGGQDIAGYPHTYDLTVSVAKVG